MARALLSHHARHGFIVPPNTDETADKNRNHEDKRQPFQN